MREHEGPMGRHAIFIQLPVLRVMCQRWTPESGYRSADHFLQDLLALVDDFFVR